MRPLVEDSAFRPAAPMPASASGLRFSRQQNSRADRLGGGATSSDGDGSGKWRNYGPVVDAHAARHVRRQVRVSDLLQLDPAQFGRRAERISRFGLGLYCCLPSEHLGGYGRVCFRLRTIADAIGIVPERVARANRPAWLRIRRRLNAAV